MSQNYSGLGYNKTTSGDSDLLLGQMAEFEDLDFSALATPRLSQTPVLCMRVRASETIAAKQVLKWTAGYFGLRVSVCGAAEEPCGVASSYIPSAASGDHFNMIRKGYGLVTATATNISAGVMLETAAAGAVALRAVGQTAGTNSFARIDATVGAATVAITASTSGRAWINCENR